jgi:voltage-gated sodium channel
LEHHRWALLFFVPFMLLSTFTVLNLFIALIVDSMQRLHQGENADSRAPVEAELARLRDEMQALRRSIERLPTTR